MRLCLASSWRVRLGLLLVALTASTGLVVPAWSATVDGTATMAGTLTRAGGGAPATATISGRVTNSFGAPIAARLLVYALDGSGRLDLVGSFPVTKAGYDLQVPAGHVTVEAVPYDSFQFFYPAWLDGVGPATATWLDLAAGDTRSVHDIAMGGGRTYRGRVIDANGVGVDKVEVTAVQDGVVYSRTTTTADGSYALPGLGNNAVGEVLIRYSRDGVITEWYNDAASEAAAQAVNNLPAIADLRPLSTTVAFDAGRALMTTAVPRLVGTFTYGDRMYAVPATWNVEPDHREFHWYCNGQFTGAVGESFAPRDGVDDHCALAVREIATKDGYQSGITESSNPVPLIRFGASTAPRVTGAATVGSTLAASPATWNLPDTEAPTYQWLRDGVAIRGATAQSYRPVAADVGHRLSITAAARRHGRAASSTSTPTALVRALSRMTATASSGLRTVAATAVLSTPGAASPAGRIVVKKGTTLVTSVAVTRTPLKVPVRLRMARGWHTLTFSYGGSTRATPVTRGVRFFVK